MSKQFDIVGIGASTLDRFLTVHHFSTGREVQEIMDTTMDGGGPVATALATAGKYGAKTAMIDRIGKDQTGQLILDDFKTYHVNTEYISTVPDTCSGNATILVHHDTGDRAVYFQRSTAGDITDVSPYEGLIKKATILHINGRHRQVLPSAISIANQFGVLVSLDGGAQRYDEGMEAITKSSQIVIVARDYAEKYTGTNDLQRAVQIIFDRGALLAGITDGAKGSHFVWPDGTYYKCEAYPQSTIVDTTGGGDSFHGAFLAKLVEQINLQDGRTPVEQLKTIGNESFCRCAQFASAVASLNTQHMGGRSGLPSLESVHQFMKN